MLYTSIILFALAAVLGITLLSFILKNKVTPKALVFTHGPLAAIALIILVIYTVSTGTGPVLSIVLFIIAALGGGILVYHDITGKQIPKWLAVVHGLIAVTAFVYLILYTVR